MKNLNHIPTPCVDIFNRFPGCYESRRYAKKGLARHVNRNNIKKPDAIGYIDLSFSTYYIITQSDQFGIAQFGYKKDSHLQGRYTVISDVNNFP